MKTSRNGIELIKNFEGCRLSAYRCSAGVLTIGYGHTKGVKATDTITMRTAEKLLTDDLVIYEKAVIRNVKVKLTQNMFDALVSFTYNLGEGNLKKSTLLKKLNKGDYVGASNEFPKWRCAGGKVNAGLVKRRAKERELFLTGIEEVTEPKKEEKQEEKHYNIPSLKGYKGFSIVDGLKQFGYQSSFAYRKELWKKLGKTTTYKGTSTQNTQLLNYLKSH